MRATTTTIFLALLTGVLGKPAVVLLGYQDSLGQYSFGYSGPDSARSEIRSLDGATRGSYSYLDASGIIQRAEYTADEVNGFRVDATNLPQAPEAVQDTPEVAAARAAHLQEHQRASQHVEAEEAQVELGEQEPTVEEPDVKSMENAVPVEEEPVPAKRPMVPPEATALTVALIPINLTLPSFSTYAAAPVAKADSLPQAMPAQESSTSGIITPAGTTLKLSPTALTSPPLQKELQGSPAESAIGDKSEQQLGNAQSDHAPTNLIALDYVPKLESFFRFIPIPYVTYGTL